MEVAQLNPQSNGHEIDFTVDGETLEATREGTHRAADP